jgi:DNA (cytosine-5)-methyltransferase 1
MLGIPQHRERVLILGIRKDLAPTELPKVPTLKANKNLTLSSILETSDVGDKFNLTDSDREVVNKWEEVVQHFKSNNVKLPTFPLWSNYWDSDIPYDDEPGWKQKFIKQNQEFYTAYKEFLEPWLNSARMLDGFTGAKRKFEWQRGAFQPNDSIFNSLFQFRPSGIRVKKANYSPALVAMAQIVYVGEKKRKLTPREVARLQSFPDTFQIPSSNSIAYKQFGNAVNVDVIKWAATLLFSI